jgi:hypothetical protein
MTLIFEESEHPGMSVKFSSAPLLVAAILLGALAAFAWRPALAHGDLLMDGRICQLKAGPFQFRLTGYQAVTGPGKEFCEDIPHTGQAVMVFESTGLPVDATTIDIRIVRDEGQRPEDDASVLTVASKKDAEPRGGGVSIEHDFVERGRYVGLFTIHGGDRVYTGRFPFTVGAVKAAQFMQYAFEAAMLTAALVTASHFARLPRKPRRRRTLRRK